MLTDHQARALMQRAADTVRVPTLATVVPPPRRAWWPAIVAVAAVGTVVVALLTLRSLGDEAASPPTSPPAPGQPVESAYFLDVDQIPAVLGYTIAEARRELEGRGLRVIQAPRPAACQVPDRVLGTNPAVGSRFAPGDTVRVDVTAPRAAIDCPREPPWAQVWDLLRFARGFGSPPVQLADEVLLYVTDGPAVTVPRERLGDPDAWTVCDDAQCHSALASIGRMVTEQWGGWGPPFLQVDMGSLCDLVPPPSLESARHIDVGVGINIDGLFCNSSVQLELDTDGQIAGVGVRQAVPNLRAQNQVRRDVATSFVAWARGERTEPPPFAAEVRLLLNNVPQRTLTGQHATDTRAWDWCDPRAGCLGTALSVLTENPRPVIGQASARLCRDADIIALPEALPDDLAESVRDDALLLEPPPADCAGRFVVQVWIGADGAMRAVNLLI